MPREHSWKDRPTDYAAVKFPAVEIKIYIYDFWIETKSFSALSEFLRKLPTVCPHNIEQAPASMPRTQLEGPTYRICSCEVFSRGEQM